MDDVASDRDFVHETEVTFGDCDPAGLVYFPRFFDFFHRTMEAWFDRRLKMAYADLVLVRKIGFPAVHTEADFARPSRFGERIAVSQRLRKIGRTSLHFEYRVWGSDETEPRVRGRTVCALVDLAVEPGNTGQTVVRPLEIPADLLQRMRAQLDPGRDEGKKGRPA